MNQHKSTQSPTVATGTRVGFVAIAIFGTLALLTTLTGGAIPPFQMMAMCFSIVFILICLRWFKNQDNGLRYLKQPLFSWLIGVGGLFGFHFFYFKGMSMAPAVEVSLITYLWPLLIVLFSSFLPGEKLRFYHLLGALLALIGCYVLISGHGELGFETKYLPGYLYGLGAAISWGLYSTLSRLVRNVPTDAVAWFCAATALLALIYHLVFETTVWPTDIYQWVGIIGLGLGPVGAAFFFWDYGVKYGNIQLIGTLAYITPLISTLLLIVAGHAEATFAVIASGLLIVSGSVVASGLWLRLKKTDKS
ncbi:MAG: DMT family transporter [Alcaligenaceae bacterium]|nr:DMT family transporter [Alcaligenaceae bacterium]